MSSVGWFVRANRLKLLYYPYLILVALIVAGYVLDYFDVIAPSYEIEKIFSGVVSSAIFFGFVGVFAAIATLISPKDESLERRLEFLITNPSVTPSTQDHIRNQVKRVSAYVEAAELQVRILEFDKSENRLKIGYSGTAKIKNTFAKETYIDDTFKIIVSPDLSDKGGVYGRITSAKFVSNDESVDAIADVPFTIRKPGEFERRAKLEISEAGVTTYFLDCWLYNSADLPYFIHQVRFCERCRFSIHNHTESEIRLDILLGKQGEVRLKANGDAHVQTISDLPPGASQLFKLAN